GVAEERNDNCHPYPGLRLPGRARRSPACAEELRKGGRPAECFHHDGDHPGYGCHRDCRHRRRPSPLGSLIVMTALISIFTIVAVLAGLVVDVWRRCLGLVRLCRRAKRTSQSGQMPVVEAALAMSLPLFAFFLLKVVITLTMASGLSLKTLSS